MENAFEEELLNFGENARGHWEVTWPQAAGEDRVWGFCKSSQHALAPAYPGGLEALKATD